MLGSPVRKAREFHVDCTLDQPGRKSSLRVPTQHNQDLSPGVGEGTVTDRQRNWRRPPVDMPSRGELKQRQPHRGELRGQGKGCDTKYAGFDRLYKQLRDGTLILTGALIHKVPTAFGKADLTLYRDAGAEVVSILSRYATSCEKASVDEMYVDVTRAAKTYLDTRGLAHVVANAKETHVAGTTGENDESVSISRQELRDGSTKQVASGVTNISEGSKAWWNRAHYVWTEEEKMLAAGAAVVNEARAQVTAETGFSCSAGISTNKMLAKLTGGMHKPNQQTLLTPQGIPPLLEGLAIDRLRGLGGDFGNKVQKVLQVTTCGEVARIPTHTLQRHFGEEKGLWLSKMAHGMDEEPVKEREIAQLICNGKTFRGANTLHSLEGERGVKYWVGELAKEVAVRLERDQAINNRVAHLLTTSINARDITTARGSVSHSERIYKRDADSLAQVAYAAVRKWASGRASFSITGLGMSATQFEASSDLGTQSITNFFASGASTSAPAASTSSLMRSRGRAKPVGIAQFLGRATAEESEQQGHEEDATRPALVVETGAHGVRRHTVEESEHGGGSTPPSRREESERAVRMQGGVWDAAGALVPPSGGERRGKETVASQAAGPSDRTPGVWQVTDSDLSQVDESVLNELPLEIQQEVRAAMKASQGAGQVGTAGGLSALKRSFGGSAQQPSGGKKQSRGGQGSSGKQGKDISSFFTRKPP